MVNSTFRPRRSRTLAPAARCCSSASRWCRRWLGSLRAAPRGGLSHHQVHRLVGAFCLALIPCGTLEALPEVSNVRFQDHETLAWDGLGAAVGYHVYGGDISAAGQMQSADCRQGSLRGTSARAPYAPPPGTAQYFLIVGFDESGEGPAGNSTSGDPRPIQARCIPARRIFQFALNGDPGDGVLDGAEPRRNASVRSYDLGSSGQTGVVLHTGEFMLQAADLSIRSRVTADRPINVVRDDVPPTVRWVFPGVDLATAPSIIEGRGLHINVNAIDSVVVPGFSEPRRSALTIEGVFGVVVLDHESLAFIEDRPAFVPIPTYQSQLRYDGPLGYGWELSANARLLPVGQNVLHFDGEGRQEYFFRTGPVSFVSPPGQFSVLVQNPDGSFTLRTPHGTLSNFHAFDGSNLEGALESLEDRNGNRITCQYDLQGLLTSVTDSLGRVLKFRYSAEGRIVEVSDFSGRRRIYSYDAHGDLVSVEAPGAGGAAGGRTTTYTYSSGFADPRLNHNLLSVIRPNEAGTGVPALHNTYGIDPLAFDFDRVVSQVIGGINASGVPAGGVLNFAYASLNPGGDPFDLTLPRRAATVLDRNGNEKVFVHNRLGNLISRTDRTNRELRPGEPDYTTRYAHDQDGNVRAVQWPQGNGVVLTYDAPGADRYREGNLLETRFLADPVAFGGRGDGRGGELADRVVTFAYDPVFNQIASATDERGNDPGYVPQNGGTWSPDRYTTRSWLDYQEGDPFANGISALAGRFGIALGTTPLNLGDLNGDGIASQASGNAVRFERPAVLLDPASRQAAIEGDTSQESVTLVSYNRFGQITGLTDAEGNRHEFSYYPQDDPDGDGSATPPPPDGRSLDGTTGGYLRTAIRDTVASPGRDNGTDPLPTQIRMDLQYDPVGNLAGLVNGRGVLKRWSHNAANEVAEVRTAAATADQAGTGGSPPTGRGESGLVALEYVTQYEYDQNGRRIASHEEIRNSIRPGAGTTRDTQWIYDILGNVVEIRGEVTAGSDRVTQHRYDANENPIRRTRPEGNSDEWAWDERDMVLTSTLGASGPRGGAPITRDLFHDANGNLTASLDALGGRVDHAYDGFDRRVRRTDEVGGTSETFHDPSNRVIRTLSRGPAGGPTPPDRSGGSNVDLEDVSLLRDERGRIFRRDRRLFVPLGASPARLPVLNEGPGLPGDGATNSTYEYDRLSRMTFAISDMNVTLRTDYDGAGRPILLTDPEGNLVELAYDAGGNVIETAETERSSVPGPPPETFLTTQAFDALDRLEMVVDNVGQTTRSLYDSLDAVIARTDASGPLGGSINRRSPGRTGLSVPINGHGNVTRYTYDAPGRLVMQERVLTSTGKGDGTASPAPDTSNPENPDGLIRLTRVWDRNSLLAQQIDDRGNTTGYSYDNLDRLTLIQEDDGSRSRYEYDARGNLIGQTDPRGVVTTNAHDPAGRLTVRSLIPTPGVAGTTVQAFEYDGLSRLTRAFDNNSPPSAGDDVTTTTLYDSLGRMIERAQRFSDGSPSRVASLGWTGEDRLISLTYPSGRQVLRDHDPIGRVASVRDASRPERVDFQYFGRSRIHTQVAHNGLRATLLDDTGTAAIGYDGARRPVLLRHLDPSNNLLAGFEYTYDRAGNRTSSRRLHEPGGPGLAEGELHAFDSANRLVASSEGMLDQNLNLIGPAADLWSWVLDGAGNWATFGRLGVPYRNTPNNLNEYDEPQGGGVREDDGVPDDFRDLVSTPLPDGLNHAHDQSGNQTDTGLYRLLWDGHHRLVGAIRNADGLPVGAYKLDALGNLAESAVTNSGSLDGTRRYISIKPGSHPGAPLIACRSYGMCTDSPIEETDPSGAVIREVILGPSGYPLWQVLGGGPSQYFVPDAAGSTAALASAGSRPLILARTTYDPYGKPTFEDASGNPLLEPTGTFLARSPLGNSELWNGMRYDFPEFGARTSDAQTDLGGFYGWHPRFVSSYQPPIGDRTALTIASIVGDNGDRIDLSTPADPIVGIPPYNPNEGRSLSRNLNTVSVGDVSVTTSRIVGTTNGSPDINFNPPANSVSIFFLQNPVTGAGPFSTTAAAGQTTATEFCNCGSLDCRYCNCTGPQWCFRPQYGTFAFSTNEFGMPTHYFFDPDRGFVPRVRPWSMQAKSELQLLLEAVWQFTPNPDGTLPPELVRILQRIMELMGMGGD